MNKRYNCGYELYKDRYYIECGAEYSSSYRCILYNIDGYSNENEQVLKRMTRNQRTR